ncbi:glucose-6-phosphatase 3-like [Sycon ciliatum]|uniref:glucose-6-phosphatase 3-like n=1 Tax=Sycon ciliatum TaxID=27933 RepID=UPI0020A86526|eukprot:scpid82382/ scgid7648/ Glucose-6-phosphatase 2; Islet-specific glucose-6-phosphatase catalytic subunit-related protein
MELELDNLLRLGIHYRGAIMTQALQREMWHLKEEFTAITTLGDPFSAYTLMFPLFVCLKKSIGRRILWSACVAEWLNIILKWLLNGQRPYWWQYESSEWSRQSELLQVPLTCETGPGSPSGHCMISAAVWYVISDTALRVLPNGSKWISGAIFWSLLSLVAVSRVFIATHFPHQVLLGSVVGVLIAKCFLSKSFRHFVDSKSATHHLAVSCVFVGVGFLLYVLLLHLGLDPSTSVRLALKHCSNRDWVHLNTTPFFSLFRMSGSLVGIGVARHYKLFSKKFKSVPLRVFCGIVSVVCAHVVCAVPIATPSPIIFYSISFIRFVLLPVSVALCTKILYLLLR